MSEAEHRRFEPSLSAVVRGEQPLGHELGRGSPKKVFELHVPEHVGYVPSGNSLGARIEQHHPLLHVGRDDRIDARVDQRFQELHGLDQFSLGFA